MVPILKPNGNIRITINFKLLNQLVQPDRYSLPRIEEIIHGLKGQRFFSKIDLKDGFFHVPLKQSDRHKTAFRVKNKLYEWNVMPQGYVNSPAIFQRFMDKVLCGLIGKCCFVYVDDILIFGKNEQEHDLGYKEVLERLVNAGLTANENKMEYKVEKIKFLGHIIELNKIYLSLDKEEAVRDMLPPKNKEEVQHFMGIVNYYRKFINKCSEKSEELLKFLRKDIGFVWTENEQKAFEVLKHELLHPKVLRQPDYEKTFILDTDASNIGIGAVLTQNFEDGEHPVIFLSRRLKDAEMNYSISEKEMLAALWAMEQLHYYLYGRKFILRTDHKALLAFNVKGEVKSRRIERWYYRLQAYAFTVVYRKGENQGNADSLSRCNYNVNNKEVFENMPESRKREIIRDTHRKLIHRGAKITAEQIEKDFEQTFKFSLIKDELSKCMKCKQFRPRNFPGIKFNEAFEVGEKVAIDILGPIENQYIIAAVDYFSRKGFAMTLESRSTQKVISFLKKISTNLNLKMLISDNAKEFSSKIISNWCTENGIKQHFTPPYYHQANGKVERLIRTIREGLQLHEGRGSLRIKLKNVMDVYNSVKHSGTGMSPNDAMNPGEWSMLKTKQYEERIQKYRRYSKLRKHEIFKEGDEVLVQEDIIVDKQAPKYIIGGRIIRALGNDTYEVLIKGKTIKRYASQIRREGIKPREC